MAVSRVLKNRIRATKNIKQITRAMEAVSAVKMRKSEQAALGARPYALAALEILKNIRGTASEKLAESHPFLVKREKGKTLFVVITSDKGLAGAFNSNIIRHASRLLKEEDGKALIVVGKKGRDFFKKRETNIVGEFTGFGDFAEPTQTLPITERILELYEGGEYQRVVLVYTNFLSALKQEVAVRSLLPFTRESLEDIVANIIPLRGKYSRMPDALESSLPTQEYKYEPDPLAILNTILPALLETEVHHAVLEANASEHSSRMIAMRNASDNAGELITKLRISYNKARQGQITKEITEISAGTEALKEAV